MQDWRRRAIYAILKQKPYNFSTNTLKAYLSTQPSSLSAFMISKTHTGAQKPHGRQLNTKVCGSKSAIFCLLCSTTITKDWLYAFCMKLLPISGSRSMNTQHLHKVKLIHTLQLLPVAQNTIFKLCAHAHSSLVPRSQITGFWLGTRPARTSTSLPWLEDDAQRY